MVVVHHLDFSRSTRVLWLLEEIGIAYEVVPHFREPGFRAPASLRAVHDLGKAPVIEDDGFTIAESAVILEYLDARYANGRFSPAAPADRLRHAEVLHFAENALASSLMINLYGHFTGGLVGTFAAIIARDVDAALGHVERTATGRYFVGDELTLADIQLAYPLELASYLGFLPEYPRAEAYLARLYRRDALARAIAVGGPMRPPL